jgi:hypothetical protein
VTVGLLGLVAAGAFLASGLVLALALALTPNPGMDVVLLILKLTDVVGWVAANRPGPIVTLGPGRRTDRRRR